MKLGIDFGTSHTVVAEIDSGNYPLVAFGSTNGDWLDYYPSLIAVKKDQVLFGFNALKKADDPHWYIIRSIKSLLNDANYNQKIQLGELHFDIKDLLNQFLVQFKQDLIFNSSLKIDPEEKINIAVAVPANSNNTQRFITVDSFQKAGFEVLNIINEPSAATMEYTRAFFKNIDKSAKKYLLVYDLGGGTFDASIAKIHDNNNRIIATQGLFKLGGDQFDEVLADIVKEKLPENTLLSYKDQVRLLQICKEEKEKISPHSKNILLEWGLNGQESHLYKISVQEYYSRCEFLIDQTVKVINRIIHRVAKKEIFDDFSSIYLVGGMSNFPLISRHLRKIYGNHKIRKSSNCVGAVAIGLAILLNRDHQFVLEESLTQHFGLWREEDHGRRMIFDPIFRKDHQLPVKGKLQVVYRRKYRPAHNIGVFRFQECSLLLQEQPGGLVSLWDTLYFPFDPSLQGRDIRNIAVCRFKKPLAFEIEEIFYRNSVGDITVQISNKFNGFTQVYRLIRKKFSV
ncbi:MAG: Hsp70 family protein [Deltaproteobacteria bacterium]|nr:Hsp70 family protein [Deltaproteobacteria bacterium]